MKACGDSIILVPIKMEKKTESGIEIVQERQRHDAQLSVGKVIDVGPLAYEKEVYFEMETNKPVQVPTIFMKLNYMTIRFSGCVRPLILMRLFPRMKLRS